MQLTPAALQALFTTWNFQFQQGLTLAKPFWDRLATQMPSSGELNTYPFMDRIPRLRKWLGERQLHNVSARSYSLTNDDYEDTLEVDRNKIEDDTYGVYGPMAKMLGEAASHWPDDLIAAAVQAGTTALVYDGQPMFSSAHPINMDNVGLGTQSNRFDTTTSGSTPLTAANYASVRASMMGYLGADNKPLGIMPNLLVVPPQLDVTARQILNAEIIAPTGGLGTNAAQAQSNILKVSADILTIPQLANNPTQWFLMDTSKGILPFLFQLRKSPQFVYRVDPNAEPVWSRKKYQYGVDARGAAGYSLWFLCAMANQ